MEDHMPDLTPPWDRIPSYITSFQSSPVKIWENSHSLKETKGERWEYSLDGWLVHHRTPSHCSKTQDSNPKPYHTSVLACTHPVLSPFIFSAYRPEKQSWWLQERCRSLSECSPQRWIWHKQGKQEDERRQSWHCFSLFCGPRNMFSSSLETR